MNNTPEKYTSLKALAKAIASYRNEMRYEEGIVISHHKALVTNLTLPAEVFGGRKVKHVPAKGNVPEYDHIRILNANCHFRNGAEILPDGSFVGRVEMKVKDLTKGDKEEIYFHLNLFPLPVGEKPQYLATINEEPEEPEEGSLHFGPTIANKEVYLHLNPIDPAQ